MPNLSALKGNHLIELDNHLHCRKKAFRQRFHVAIAIKENRPFCEANVPMLEGLYADGDVGVGEFLF